jgi:hypothetical protein
MDNVKPNIFLRKDAVFQHHLFKSDIQDCLKNVSYKKFEPDLRKIPHKHFYHSVNPQGKALDRCSNACGHWHRVTWQMDKATGNLIAISGPAMRDATRQLKNGLKKSAPEECTWSDVEGRITKDDHTHEWTYEGTDVLSPSILERGRALTREQALEQGVDLSLPKVKPMGQARPFSDEDGVSIAEL